MASCPSPRPRPAPPGRADSVRASPTPHPHSAPPRRADSARAASRSPHPRSAPHSAARTSQPRRADSVRASPTPHPHSVPPRRVDSARACSPSPRPRSAPQSAVRTSQPRRAESASSSPPPHPDSVRMYAVRDSDLEFVAELGRTDEASHAAEACDQAHAPSQALSEVLLVFCSKGSIVGLANLFPDAPRFGQLLSDDDDDGGDEDDDDEEEEEDEEEEGEDADAADKKGNAAADDDDEDGDGSTCTDATSQHQRISDDDEESDDDDEEKEEDGSTYTATDDSSNNVSSNEEGDDDEDEAAYDWDENDAERQEMECGPAYFLKLRVWPSTGYATIVLFDGISWISTQNYTLSCLSSTEAEIMVEKLADVSQIGIKIASSAVLLRSEYEGAVVNSAAAETFVKFKLMPSLYYFNVDDNILGKGSFCNVRSCTAGDKHYAVKIIKPEDLIDLDEPREVAIHSTLRSPHVVKFLNAWTESHIPVSYEELSQSDDSRKSGEAPRDMQRPRYILILMELCEKSLADYLSAESRELDAEKSLHIFNEIVLGVQYIHGQNVIHRDLKPGNVFLGKDNKFKLGDFGQSRVQPSYIVSFKATPNLGTPFYEAPELQEGERISDKVDIYPLGVIYLELFIIFKTAMDKDKTFRILRDEDGSKITWEGDLCLFKQMIAFDPVKRPSVKNILERISQVRSLQKSEASCVGLDELGQSVHMTGKTGPTPAEEAETRA